MTASVSIITQERENALRVPTAALRFRPPADANVNAPANLRGNVLWVLDNGQLKAIPVRLGITDRRYSEVISDELDETTAVVIEHVQNAKTQAGSGMRFRMSP
jgi:HlyD family secretion protein